MIRLIVFALALAPLLGAEGSGRQQALSYSAATIVNAASNVPGALAPNTIATLYGSGLAYSTRQLLPSDIGAGPLPVNLGGVSVLVGSTPAVLYYVSPDQINFLVPSLLRPLDFDLEVVLDGRAGPAVRVSLLDSAPALFQADARTVVASHSEDWSVVTDESPARPGEVIVLYATGLGATIPDAIHRQVPRGAAPLQRISEFEVLLGGVAVDSDRILYAGVCPNFAGLYQINLKLPEKLEDDPEVRIGLAGRNSPPGLRLPVRTPENQPNSPQQFPTRPR